MAMWEGDAVEDVKIQLNINSLRPPSHFPSSGLLLPIDSGPQSSCVIPLTCIIRNVHLQKCIEHIS